MPQGLCSPQAATAPGGPASSTDRASAWWDRGQSPAPVKPGWPQAPLCTGTVLSVHGARLLAVRPGTHPLSVFVPPFYRGKKYKAVSCSGHHLALRIPFPKEARLVPWQGQRDVWVMLGGDMGASSCGPPCPDPLCCVL